MQILIWAAFAVVSASDSAAKVDPKVYQKVAASPANTHVLLYLEETADLSGSEKLHTKEEKGRFVYETLRDHAARQQKELIQWLENEDIEFRAFYLVNAVAIYNPSFPQLLALEKRPEIKKIILDPEIKRPPLEKFKPEFTLQTLDTADNLDAIGAPRVWNEMGVRGEGIVVASQDTGVEWTHPALKRQYRGYTNQRVDHAYHWHDAIRHPIGGKDDKCGYNLSFPCDDDGHGTHTVGSMLGFDGQEKYVGVAPDAQWIACRNMDAGEGRASTYLECFEFFLAPYAFGENSFEDGRPELAPHIINNSWGCPLSEGCHGFEILDALIALKSAGIMVVVSAGNDGPSCASIADQPASHTGHSLRVGAFDHRSNRLASFSSKGPSAYDGGLGPDVVAPGVSILSSVPGGKYEKWMWSGTSMAGPHVAGLVALLWSARPDLIGKVEESIKLIQNSATPKPAPKLCGERRKDQRPNNSFGWGVIDAYETIRRALK